MLNFFKLSINDLFFDSECLFGDRLSWSLQLDVVGVFGIVVDVARALLCSLLGLLLSSGVVVGFAHSFLELASLASHPPCQQPWQ